MLIAQVTDCHIGFDPADPEEDNVRRLRRVLARITDGPNRPDLLLLTGDLVSAGGAENYARLAELLSACPIPHRLMAGNWDERGELIAAFPECVLENGFLQFEVALAGLRLLALDTTEPGRHGGSFCEARAAWLRAKLDEDQTTPVLIAMHHPPIVSGIDWMDGTGNEAWIARFAEAIRGHSQIVRIVTGHLHRTVHTTFTGVPVTVCPSTAPAVTLDFAPYPPDLPDGRAMVSGEPAAFALHRWDGAGLTSYFEAVLDEPWETLAGFDEAMQKTVQNNAAERE